tara:strand:- start:1118 stop:1327 length:210 start_codon:yes stop_codon:yes gene_type:complete
MRNNKKIEKLFKDNGFFLARASKHNIWKNIYGNIIVSSRTPSCPYTYIKLKNRIKNINQSHSNAFDTAS